MNLTVGIVGPLEYPETLTRLCLSVCVFEYVSLLFTLLSSAVKFDVLIIVIVVSSRGSNRSNEKRFCFSVLITFLLNTPPIPS